MDKKKINRIIDFHQRRDDDDELSTWETRFSGKLTRKDQPDSIRSLSKGVRKRYIYQKGVRKNWKPKEDG